MCVVGYETKTTNPHGTQPRLPPRSTSGFISDEVSLCQEHSFFCEALIRLYLGGSWPFSSSEQTSEVEMITSPLLTGKWKVTPARSKLPTVTQAINTQAGILTHSLLVQGSFSQPLSATASLQCPPFPVPSLDFHSTPTASPGVAICTLLCIELLTLLYPRLNCNIPEDKHMLPPTLLLRRLARRCVAQLGALDKYCISFI